VPQAAVTIRETAKGVVFTTTTNASGFYAENQLIPGNYVVTVEAPNFKKLLSEPIVVQVDNVSRLNVRLTPGTTTETVVFANNTPLLQTDSADIATTFTSEDILSLPDYDRNVLSLEFLVPGVTLPTGDATAPSENPQGSFRARINGRVYGATGYQIDGTDDQDAWLGSAVINPNPDSVAEAKFSIENFDAENGFVAGGLLAFSTKSGSNKLHGSLFEYLINNSPGFRTFGATPFTSNPAAQYPGAPPLKSNQSITWHLNGKELGVAPDAVAFSLPHLDRGTYALAATITDQGTGASQNSNSVTFYVRQPSALAPQHK